MCIVPLFREARTDDALTVERLRLYSKESLDERTRGDAYTVAEVAVTFTTGSIEMRQLPKIGRTACYSQRTIISAPRVASVWAMRSRQ